MSPVPEAGAGYRGVVVCAAPALGALLVGGPAVIADESLLALAAAVVGVAAAGVGALVDVRRTRAEDSLWEARAQAGKLPRELHSLQAAVTEEQTVAAARHVGVAGLPPGTETEDWEIDPVSGL